MEYTFNFYSVFRDVGPLFQGLLISLQLTTAATAIGLTLGFAIALMVLSRWTIVRVPTMLFIEFFRCTPAIVQVVWFFYCVPIIFDVYVDAMTMGILALGLNLSAFNAEAYRASIQSVPREQLDAGVALGLNGWQRIKYIILPTAFRSSVPVLVTNAVGTFQQSALVAIVAIQDLMYAGKTLATETYRPIETFTTVALIYFLVSFPITQAVEWYTRRRDAATS